MLWFDGSVRNAVERVKSSGAFLLVFVQGEDNLSKKYETYLNETIIKPQNYVALKISHDSVALQQLKQIYVSVPIPSVFLIQNNGIPIEVVSSGLTSDIYTAISDAVKKQEVNIKSATDIKSKVNPVPEIAKSSENEARQRPSAYVRNIGHKVFDLTEEELKRRLNEIRGFPRFLVLDKPSSPSQTSLSKTVSKINSARIQFHLPNNDRPSWEFPHMSTLGDVRAYLTEKMKLSHNFKLLRTYPRTAFTPQDEHKTLEELSLTPNANLIVVPIQDKTVQARVKNLIVRENFILTIVNTLLNPITIFFKFIKKHVLGIQDRDDTVPRRLVSDTAVEKILNKKTSTSNIHGFKFDDDQDTDSEHPDNGNSTQQKYEK